MSERSREAPQRSVRPFRRSVMGREALPEVRDAS